MISEDGKREMKARYEKFHEMWKDVSGADDSLREDVMIQCYYLDVIAGQLMELNKPKSIVMPMQAGRN